MKAEDLYRELKEGNIRPVYYLYGDDDFLKEESFKKLKEVALHGAMVDFNYDLFYCGEAEMSKVVSAASTMPVMATRRLVVLKDADRLRAGEEEQLMQYLGDPSPVTSLVIMGRGIDKRKKFFSLLGKVGTVVEHSRPYEREMPRWIRWVAKKKGLEVSDGACRYLVDIIGNDLTSVANEMDKVAAYAGDRKRIDIEDIEAVTVDIKARNVFQLIDALGAKNLKKSLENLKRLLDGGESPILILSMILRQLRMIWTGLDILKRGGAESDLRKKIKLPPFVFKGYLRQLKMFKEEELKAAFERLFDLDLKFKSSRIDKERALELLVFDLCGY